MVGTLDRKVLRDLWRMKGQAIAIAAVIAVGVLLLVMMDGLVHSLEETKRAYYDRYRMADIFAPLTRAPREVLSDLERIPGVTAVQGRLSGGALIDVPGVAVPVRGQTVSLPAFGPPRLNDVFVAAGRMLDPSRPNEILVLRGFAEAHGLEPGDTLTATLRGGRRTFYIAGLAQAPEFLYSAAPGEIVPDDSRFAVLWVGAETLEAAFDLDGAFNEALLALARGARAQAVIDAVDAILAPYGGTGAFGVEDQFSNRFIVEEIDGLRVSNQVVPPVFLGVAAFLLYIVIARMIQAEREQIGLLKAFGFSSWEISTHYFKLVLVIAVVAAVVGGALGVVSGQALAGYYQVYYKFPFLVFEADARVLLTGLFVSVAAASAGSLWVLRQVFVLAPAVAMRPLAPPDYSRAARFRGVARRVLDQPTRMVLRRLLRAPGRALAAVVGIAAGMALSVAMVGVLGAFNELVEQSFSVIDRSDVTVTFVEPVSDTAIFALARLPGVIEVEPFRGVATVLSHGRREYRAGVNGLVAEPRLNRVVDRDARAMGVRADGITLSQPLADILAIRPGQMLIVDVREGRQPELKLPVVGVADTLLGAPAFMELAALNRALGEPNRVSGAYLRIDQAHSAQVYRALKAMPTVAGVSLRAEARQALEALLDEGAGAIRFVMAAMAALITFGIVYNSARITYAERARDLASLRVLGFTRGEAAFVLLGELALITLSALPLGAGLGYLLALAIAEGFSTDLYQIPATVTPDAFALAALAVVAAGVVSGAMVRRDLDRMNLVSALTTRE